MALRTQASNAAIRRAFSCRAAATSTAVRAMAPKAASASTAHAGIDEAGPAVGSVARKRFEVVEVIGRRSQQGRRVGVSQVGSRVGIGKLPGVG